MSSSEASRDSPSAVAGATDLRRVLRHGGRLARIDVTRTVRRLSERRSQLAVFVVLAGVGSLWFGALTYFLGRELARGTVPEPFADVAIGRGVLALFWLVLTVVFVVRSMGQRGTLANAEGVLTIVPTVDAVVGVVLSELAYLTVYLGPMGLAIGVGLAVGGGAYGALLFAPLTTLAMGVAAVSVGYPLGLGVRHVVTRFPFVARHKNGLIVLVFLVYFAGLMTGGVNELMVALIEPMQQTPPGWFADLLVLGVPLLSGSTTLAAAVLVATLFLPVVAVPVATAIAQRHWFSDPVLAGESEPTATAAGTADETRIERALGAVFDRKTAALVVLAWRRAFRSPMKLLYAAYPVFLLAGFAPTVFDAGTLPPELPLAVLLIVAWGAGVAFALNPLGDQGSVLPATLLSRVDGASFVRATALASLVVAVPLAVVATAGAALASPLSSGRTVVLVAAAPVVLTLSTLVAVAIGMVFPRFTAINVTRSTKAVVPSLSAFVVFTVYLVATALTGALVADEFVRTVVAALLSWALPFGLSVAPGELYWVAAALLVPLVLAPVASYRYATRRFDRYVLG